MTEAQGTAPSTVGNPEPKPRYKTKPIVVKVGNVQVKIYRRQRRKGDRVYSAFDVADFSSGKRCYFSYADEKEARDKASDIATKLANREGAVLALTSADRAAYLRALELLKPTGLSLELAAAQIAEAYQKLAGRSLMEAVNYFLRHCPVTLPRRTVSQVMDEMLRAKKSDGASKVYLRDLTLRLARFAGDFQKQVSDVSEAEINEWLRGLNGSARNRNNYRNAVRVLLRYAVTEGYLSKEHLDFERVKKAAGEPKEVTIFTAEELLKLLGAARGNRLKRNGEPDERFSEGAGLVPLLVLGGFAGLRTAEIERQLWQDVMLDRGFIRVTGAKGNTAQKRLVPISENLREWLAPVWRKEGLCCNYGRTSDAIARLAERAGLKWKHNALRHSYGSYRLALLQDPAKVAYEMGNSPKMVIRHYRELVLPEEATTWFSITPGKDGKIIVLQPEKKEEGIAKEAGKAKAAG